MESNFGHGVWPQTERTVLRVGWIVGAVPASRRGSANDSCFDEVMTYQSTHVIPSFVLVGAIFFASSCEDLVCFSNNILVPRSAEGATRLGVLVVIESLSCDNLVFSNTSKLAYVDVCDSFSSPDVLSYASGHLKPGTSSGYFKTRLRVTYRRNWPNGASRMISFILALDQGQ